MRSFLLAFCGCGFHSGGWGTVALASSFCPLMGGHKRFVPADWFWEAWPCPRGRAMLSKPLIQISADSVHSLSVSCLVWRDQGALQKNLCQHVTPRTAPSRALVPSAGHCQPSRPQGTHRLTGRSGSVPCRSCLVFPGSLCTQGFVCALQVSVSPSCGNSVIKSHYPSKSDSLGIPGPFARSAGWEVWCGA